MRSLKWSWFLLLAPYSGGPREGESLGEGVLDCPRINIHHSSIVNQHFPQLGVSLGKHLKLFKNPETVPHTKPQSHEDKIWDV